MALVGGFRGLCVGLTLLAGCATQEIDPNPAPLGDFRLGHNITIADDIQEGPFSRDLDIDAIETAFESAIDERLGRYDGDGLYHIGVYIGAGVLAQPGVPIIYTPSSNFVMDVSVFDNATRERLTEEPERFIIGEGIENTVPILGSGATRNREKQLENVAQNSARRIEAWLRENEDEWFAPKPGQERVPYGPEDRISAAEALNRVEASGQSLDAGPVAATP